MAELAIGSLLTSLASAATTIAPFAALAGTAATAYGTIASGKAAAEIGAYEQERLRRQGLAERQASELEAKSLEVQAKEERAAGQREAFALQRNKKLALSRLQNVAAGSGFLATDPSNLAIADEIEKYGTVQEQMAMYGGDSRAESLRNNAAGRRFTGQAAYDNAIMAGSLARAEGAARRDASYLSAGGSMLEGVSTFASRFAPKRSRVGSPLDIRPGRYG